MKLPLSWLNDYIDLSDIDPDDLAEVLYSLGHEVEGVERVEPVFTGVTVGRVLEVGPHPDADRIRLCSVTTGGDPVEIVCGAWNFEAGAIVPVAPPGATLAGGLTLERREIRGVVSNGMICSAQELGLGEDADGIMVLDPATPVGSDFLELVALPDVVYDLSITPNRPDAMSMVGIARELGAYYDRPVAVPEPRLTTSSDESSFSVKIDDPTGCRRFVGREVRDVTPGPSPLWMQLRLQRAGVRSISNLVDVTNYVMLELGQPIHGYDFDRVGGESLLIRRARPGETMTTLDDVERRLSPNDLVIEDGAGQLQGFAGIMGGADSEITGTTTRVLIEAASWDPPTILFGSRRHGLRSEASARFERGVDPNLPPLATARVAELIQATAGGEILHTVVDEVPVAVQPWIVEMPMRDVHRLIGVDIPRDDAASYLERLGFGVAGDDPLVVTVPTRRPDVTRSADLVEEVARLYGYDRLTPTLPTGPSGGLLPDQLRERTLRSALTGAGFSEAQTFSFHGREDLDRLELPSDDPRRNAIVVRNPLREEESLMRSTLLVGLLSALSYNRSHRLPDVALFEIGRVFYNEPSPHYEGVPHQPRRLAAVAMGSFGDVALGMKGRPVDVYAMTALWRTIAQRLGLGGSQLRSETIAGLHPGRGAQVILDGNVIGTLGELHPAVARRFELPGRVAVMEVDVAPIVGERDSWVLAEPSLYPPVEFDLAFLVDHATPASRVVSTVSDAGADLVESVDVFDEYHGLANGKKSLGLRVVLRSDDKTLTADEAATTRTAMVEAVVDAVGGELRGET